MSLFQKSVEKKYLDELDSKLIDKKYKAFQEYFGNSKIQENIKNSKEEQFQEGFLRELFVNIFDYTLNPNPEFNLTTEQKNVSDSKKADGAILKEDSAIAVIELKSTDTADLDTVESQAFGYKNHHPNCVYVITSNFEKIRFYIQNAVDYIEFDLFNLDKEDFSLLWLCLSKDNLLNDLPQKIKDSSVLEEEDVTKKLYADYSKFRREIFNNLVENNPDNDKLLLFKKTQKLLDRFLFIFFAEDRLLLPPNSISEIVQQWTDLKDKYDEYFPLYHRFKKYFGYLNTGYKGKKYEIFPYNGGLFAPDEILDNILIDDEILHKHTLQLSKYDFETDVDVNILGHIFEHSLGEIEIVQAEIKGENLEQQTTRRKKEGIFYTPKYITKYIVENTVGKLCREKKAELGIVDKEYAKGRRNRNKKIVKSLDENLNKYRNWLLSLTILDPACGSGAFLNQTLDFLIKEHQKIDELRAQLLGGSIVFSDITKDILEKNIYGVDLNEESVEIAKLSLWLRTAQKGRKLNKLNKNIKCGNSLIDDPEIAGDKAFDWKKEFPEVFDRGGFDVVIGNPPYVHLSNLPKYIHEYFEKEYSEIHTGYNDLMYYFLYRGVYALNKNGVASVITSNYFLGNTYAKSIRKFLKEYIISLINFSDFHVFSDANVHTAIINLEKNPKSDDIIFYSKKNTIPINSIDLDKNFEPIKIQRSNLSVDWLIADLAHQKIIKKINNNSTFLGSISNIEQGSKSGKNSVFRVSIENINKYNLESDLLRKNVKNGNIYKFIVNTEDSFLIYVDNETKVENYPNIYSYLLKHRDILEDRNEVKKGAYPWYRFDRPRNRQIFDAEEKIVVPYRSVNNRFAYDNQQLFNDGGDIRAIVIESDNFLIKYILGLLNSKLIDWYYGFIGKPKGNSREYFNEPLSKIPIANASKTLQGKIANNVDLIIKHKNDLQILYNNFDKYLKSQYKVSSLSKKIQNLPELTFREFLKGFNKDVKKLSGKKLSKSEEIEWMEVFENKKSQAQSLVNEIDKIENEINQLVYAAYGLSAKEIKVVENS